MRGSKLAPDLIRGPRMTRAPLLARVVQVERVAAAGAGAAQAEQALEAAVIVASVARRLRRRVRNGAGGVARDDRLLEALDALGERAHVVAARLLIGVDGRAQL